MRKPRALSAADTESWVLYARHVAPLAGRPRPVLPDIAPAPPPAKEAGAPAPPAPAPPRARRDAPLSPLATPAGIDAATFGRFAHGRIPAQRTLDLHGRTVQTAFHALSAFLLAARAEQIRCVEIITGRGNGEQGGAIRREIMHWLNGEALRPIILAVVHPYRNAGAVRVLLRRVR